jgi:hypothetical protein
MLAFVSTLLRRRRLEELASVNILASSDRALFAVADWYVVGWAWGARWAGIAGATPVALDGTFGAAGVAADWIVVSVVVMLRTEVGGEENVLL